MRVCSSLKIKNKEDIARWQGDMNLCYSGGNDLGERVRCRFCHPSIKFLSLSQRAMLAAVERLIVNLNSLVTI